MIARTIRYFDRQAFVACDARCSKAWGINARPRVELSGDPDDYAFLSDDEVGEAPKDPGTYEGGHAKPTCPIERLNKWCVRECERSMILSDLEPAGVRALPDFSRRAFNRPESADLDASGPPLQQAQPNEGRGT